MSPLNRIHPYLPGRQIQSAITSLCLVLFLAVSHASDDTIWSVEQAHTAIQANELIMLDVRTRREWKKTGIADGAWPVSMHERGFGEKLQSILENNPEKKIGLICAVGGRSGKLLAQLKGMGLSNFVDVSEGMLGSTKGPGWIAAGLQVVSLDEAKKNLPADLPK